MKRREFIALLGGAAILPHAARAQERAMPVIGFLNTASPEPFANLVRAFREGLSETGYVEGGNVAIEYRWAAGRGDRLQEMAADLVRRQVNVIVATGGSPAVLAVKAATTTIPIVFQIGVDPVEVGLVQSLNRPGGNITGATMMAVELGSKRLELLHELVPTATMVGALVNPTSPGAKTQMHDLSAAAGKLGLRLHIVEASSERDLEPAFAELLRLRADALWIGADPLFNGQSEQLAALTLRHRIPAIYQFREFAAAGGLMSYSGSITDAYRQAGVYTGRVLKGDMPADLPVQQSTKVELILNLKTAKTIGLTVPSTLLGRADEVID
jgi:putative tryptophan/tyrosine transport system substrate-binding protein